MTACAIQGSAKIARRAPPIVASVEAGAHAVPILRSPVADRVAEARDWAAIATTRATLSEIAAPIRPIAVAAPVVGAEPTPSTPARVSAASTISSPIASAMLRARPTAIAAPTSRCAVEAGAHRTTTAAFGRTMVGATSPRFATRARTAATAATAGNAARTPGLRGRSSGPVTSSLSAHLHPAPSWGTDAPPGLRSGDRCRGCLHARLRISVGPHTTE